MTRDRGGPVGLAITSGDAAGPAVVAPRLHVAVLGWIPETGIAGAGWLTNLPQAIGAVTVEPESGLPLDLLREAGMPVTPDLLDVFGIPPEAGASQVFVFFLPGMSGRWQGGLRLEIRHQYGLVEDTFIPATGDFSEIGRIIELAPLNQALGLAERLLARWDGAAAAGLPPVVENWLARLHQRVGKQSLPIGSFGEVLRVGTDGMLLRGRLPVATVQGAAAITLVSLGGRRIALETPLPAVPTALDEFHEFAVFAAIPELRPDERLWFLEAAIAGRIERIPFVCPAASPPLRGLEAALALLEPPPPDPERVMERAVVPAADRFWLAARCGSPVATSAVYGEVAGTPQVSVVVPLKGCIDRMRHQIAQFSNDPEFTSAAIAELIFVVDDVSLTEELRRLSQGLYDTYGVPFRTVALDRTLGCAAAGNRGADAASGSILLFLGADVLPKRSQWLGRFLSSHRALDRCGVLACRLLFEDDSIRHSGVSFRIATNLPGLWEEHDPAVGLPGDCVRAGGAVRVPAVAGACLMIDRMVFRRLGGFAEDYLFGGFADYDLCLAAQAHGLHVYCDPEVELYQLATAAAGEARWQKQLTQYNRWKHSRKWHSLIPSVVAATEA